jgi:hypothetical protein
MKFVQNLSTDKDKSVSLFASNFLSSEVELEPNPPVQMLMLLTCVYT